MVIYSSTINFLKYTMIVSDRSLKEKIKKGQIVIDPFDYDCVQPASYDLHLGNKLLLFDDQKTTVIDVKKKTETVMKEVTLKNDESFIIKPGVFVLGNVKEITGVDEYHVGRLEGKSSLGRVGLIIHATAGFLDPGNKLRMTLEMVNLSGIPIKIYAGMKIAQIAFEMLDQRVERSYGDKALGSKYYGDMTVKASQMYKNFTK